MERVGRLCDDSGTSMPEVRANGIRLYYEEHGEGTPILGIHGSGSSAIVMWADAVAPLSRLGRLILYDRRGHSGSERPEPLRITREGDADDAAALLSALDAAPAVVVGRSYGGDVALELARRHPDKVLALVLLEPALLHLDPEAKRWEDELHAQLRAAAGEDERVAETLIEAALGPSGWEALPAEARDLFTANAPAIVAEIEGLNADFDEAALSAIEHPTLLISAAESPEVLRRIAARLASLLPDVEEVRVGGGHLIDPADPVVLRFVERVA
jgi:pimeloyl-ACP methyl ester carboxylesterase